MEFLTREWTFIFLYGALVMVGAFLSIFWTSMAVARVRMIAHPVRHDRAAILAIGLAVSSVGLLVVDAGRLFGNLMFGLSPILMRGEAYVIGFGLTLLLLGFLCFVWLADLERDPPRFTWLLFVGAGTVLWGIISVFIAPTVPYDPVVCSSEICVNG